MVKDYKGLPKICQVLCFSVMGRVDFFSVEGDLGNYFGDLKKIFFKKIEKIAISAAIQYIYIYMIYNTI